MKKIILGLLILVLLSGCSAEYNLTITDEEFIEMTTLVTDTSLQTPEQYEDMDLKQLFDKSLEEYYEPVYFNDEKYNYYEGGYQNNVTFYDLDKYVNGTKEGIKATYNFNYLDFYRSNIVKQCFKELSVQSNDEYVMLRTNNKCDIFDEYPLLENITINISTDLEVVATNADSENGNTYTWNITRDNYTNRPVRITYVGNEEDNKVVNPIPTEPDDEQYSENKIKNNSKYKILIIIGSFVILIVVIVGIIKYKKRHN